MCLRQEKLTCCFTGYGHFKFQWVPPNCLPKQLNQLTRSWADGTWEFLIPLPLSPAMVFDNRNIWKFEF